MRSFISVTGTCVSTMPSRRRSQITVSPTNSSRNITCVDSTSGYMNNDSRSAVLPSVAASHSQKARSDTLFDRGDARVEPLVAVHAGLVEVSADVEERILVLRLGRLHRAEALLSHGLRELEPLVATPRTAREHQQVS